MKSIIIKIYVLILSLLVFVTIAKGEESKWPREISSSAGKITIFQPEIESFADNKMECRSAVIVKMDEKTDPVFGAIWYECRLSTDRDNRIVTLLDLNIVADKFPDIEDSEIEEINSYIEKEVPKWKMEMSLDEIITGLEFNEKNENYSEKLNNEAPEIIFTTTPAALILIDGDPLWEEIEGTDFDYVVNTPFFIVKDITTGVFYLKGGDNWYSTTTFYEGWVLTNKVPRKLKNIESEQYNDETPQNETTPPSQIIISTSPAELLISNGEPQYSTIANTSLIFMTNTDDDIILDIEAQEYYVLISGRWFKSKELNSNSWTFVAPDNLLEDFALIPENSPMSNVRASVSGTREAKEAVLETKIPQTAEVNRNSATLDISFDGAPVFETIEGTDMMYAVNTNKDVLFIDRTYYCCDNAVWFESSDPLGTWTVAIKIPREIMNIPPEYPIYNVKYVFIFDYTSDVVHLGYLQGYVNNFSYHGCVFYGTGFQYKPWRKNDYYSRPLTYGYSAHYNSYSGWGFSYGVSFEGFKWIDYSSRYNSRYDGYWGPSGYRHGYYRRTTLGKKRGFSKEKPKPIKDKKRVKLPEGSMARNVATNNVYMKRNNGVARTGTHRFDPKTGKQISKDTEKPKAKVSGRSNNLYSDQSGNVYKRKNNGNWEQKSNRTNSRKKTSTKQNNATTSTTNRRTSQKIVKENNKQKQTSSNRTTQQKTNTTAQRQRTNKPATTTSSRTTTKPSSKTTVNRNSGRSNATTQRKTTTSRQKQTNTKSNLNQQYQSRTRSSERTKKFTTNKTQNRYTQPTRTNTQKRTTQTKKTGGQKRSSTKATPANKKSTPVRKGRK